MKLTDEQGNEYKFDKTWNAPEINKGTHGYLKPVDSWPKEGDEYWFINADGDVGHIEQNRYGLDENDKFLGVYRTEQEAEYAAERIRSIQKMKYPITLGGGDRGWVYINVKIPKKYLKAWQELSKDEMARYVTAKDSREEKAIDVLIKSQELKN